MTDPVTIPFWLFFLIVVFAGVTFASHFLFPSVRWFFRRRMERVVARLNERLETPIQPFKLTRRYDLIQRLLYDPAVNRAILEYADEEGVREDVAFEKARSYAREIVPAFSASAYFGVAIRAARALSHFLYDVEVSYRDESHLRDVNRDATVVFVMNHRSNMDYVLMTYLAADRSALSYAVGEWARIWPLSGLIRAMGAYFIRRKSRTPLYRKVLERYVQLAIEGGVAQGIYPEGGLSLDGKLAPPKLGLLKYISEGARETGTPVVFVPVALNYDRVLEDTILINAASEGHRRFRSSVFKGLGFVVNQVWLKLTGRYERFGRVAVRFGDPLALNTCPDKSVEDLSALLMDRIKEALPVLPVPFVCQQLLKSEILTEDELIQTAEMQLGAQVGNVASFVRGGIEILLRRKVIAATENGYLIEPDRVQLAEFYGNSIPLNDG